MSNIYLTVAEEAKSGMSTSDRYNHNLIPYERDNTSRFLAAQALLTFIDEGDYLTLCATVCSEHSHQTIVT